MGNAFIRLMEEKCDSGKFKPPEKIGFIRHLNFYSFHIYWKYS